MNEFIAIILTGIILEIVPRIIDHSPIKRHENKIFTILIWLFIIPTIYLIYIGVLYSHIFLVLLGIAIYTLMIIFFI